MASVRAGVLLVSRHGCRPVGTLTVTFPDVKQSASRQVRERPSRYLLP
jgi:hypothetical protein